MGATTTAITSLSSMLSGSSDGTNMPCAMLPRHAVQIDQSRSHRCATTISRGITDLASVLSKQERDASDILLIERRRLHEPVRHRPVGEGDRRLVVALNDDVAERECVSARQEEAKNPIRFRLSLRRHALASSPRS